MGPSAARKIVIAVLAALLLTLGACKPSSGGRTIFATGKGHAGAIPRSSMGGAYTTSGPGCAFCHGAEGTGGGIGPPITRAVLGTARTITHRPSAETPSPQPVTEGPWTTAQTVETVKTGKTPEGNFLGGRMPKWKLDAQDAAALEEYLGTL